MNLLPATIAAVASEGSIALVDASVGSHRFTATLVGNADAAGWRQGMPVMLMFKETEVALARNLSGMISMRNRMPALVVAIEAGKLLTRVRLDFDGHRISSVITSRSAQTLRLAVGDAVEALVKANEMAVAPERGA